MSRISEGSDPLLGASRGLTPFFIKIPSPLEGEGRVRGSLFGHIAACRRVFLTDDELAFYDALEVNDSAVKLLDEPMLVNIARELVDAVKKNVTIDWTVRDNVRAQLGGE